MSTLINMYRVLKGSPVTLLGGAILITGSTVYTYRKIYEPYAARKRRAESEMVAEYLFRREQGLPASDGESPDVAVAMKDR